MPCPLPRAPSRCCHCPCCKPRASCRRCGRAADAAGELPTPFVCQARALPHQCCSCSAAADAADAATAATAAAAAAAAPDAVAATAAAAAAAAAAGKSTSVHAPADNRDLLRKPLPPAALQIPINGASGTTATFCARQAPTLQPALQIPINGASGTTATYCARQAPYLQPALQSPINGACGQPRPTAQAPTSSRSPNPDQRRQRNNRDLLRPTSPRPPAALQIPINGACGQPRRSAPGSPTLSSSPNASAGCPRRS
jgi:hypothetical protein